MPIVLVSVGPERTQTIERAVAARCATGRACRREPRDADPDPRRRRRRRASTPWPGSWPASRASTRSSSRRAAPRIAEPSRGSAASGRRPARSGGGRRRVARRGGAPSSSSSARRRRSRPASPMRCATAGIAVFGPSPAAAADRDRARRSATRSPRRPASGWPAPARSTDGPGGASRSRPSSPAAGSRRRRQGRRPRRRQGRDGLRIAGEAERAIERWLRAPARTRRGSRRARVVVEERLSGREASVIAAVRRPRRAARCPPRATTSGCGDGDTGPNTGGMGAYSPLPDLPDAAVDGILASVPPADPRRAGPPRHARSAAPCTPA